MTVEHLKMLYDYTYWAHGKVWECVLELSDEQLYQPLDYSVGSIHHQLVHTMMAEWIWFSRLQGTSPNAVLNPDDYPTLDDVRAKWVEIEATVRTYLNTLINADLSKSINYRTTEGSDKQMVIGGILSHVVNHSTDHRAQTLAMMHTLGAKTVEQDLIFYLLEKTIRGWKLRSYKRLSRSNVATSLGCKTPCCSIQNDAATVAIHPASSRLLPCKSPVSSAPQYILPAPVWSTTTTTSTAGIR